MAQPALFYEATYHAARFRRESPMDVSLAVLAAQEFVLLKSCLPAAASSWPQLAASGFVDAYFPQAVKSLDNVRCVNARLPGTPEMAISGDRADSIV